MKIERKIYDITHPLNVALALWPGDAPYVFTWNALKQDGASVNLGSLAMSVHTGTHADAPFHYDDSGATIERADLEVYCGPSRVIDVTGLAVLGIEVVKPWDLGETPRILFKTGGWSDPSRFPETVPTMDRDLPDYLGAQGVVLVGLDLPSVDAIDSKTLPLHHALGRNGISILENLKLDGVPPGEYDLFALPLRIDGADASPVRAILITS